MDFPNFLIALLLNEICIDISDECYSSAKKALHTSLPERLLCREKETQTIQSFLKNHLDARKPGSLYISGAPGTGKTACLKQILQQQKVFCILPISTYLITWLCKFNSA